MTKKNLSDLLREETQPPEATSQTSPPTTRRATSRRGPTKADLEQQVKDLTASLAASLEATQGQDTKLLEQIKALQTDLETQQSRLFELKDALADAEKAAQQKETQLSKLTTELEEAKQVILKMSQPAPEPKPAPISERAPLAVKMSRRAPAKHIPEYAIQRGEQRSMVSDMDIGWFD